jgi:DNA polymerase-4
MRTIAHLDLDTFFVSVERLINTSLIGKPVIVGGGSDRGVVAACSYEARKYGVHSAMPMKMAKYLCPDAIYVRGDYDQYSKYSAMVTEVIAEKAPLFEKASIDEHYIDLTGMDRFFGCLKWTHELRERIIKETGLPVSFGMSVNKCVSKIATDEIKPNGEIEIPQEKVKPFLYPLPVNKVPMIGQKTSHLLRSMGIKTVGTLAEIPVEMLYKVLGENGMTIWERANGIDNTPVVPYHDQKSISSETTFERDTTDMRFLNDTLTTLVSNVAFELRKQNRVASTITVKIRYSNFDTHTAQTKVYLSSSDHVLIPKAKELFKKLYDRRMLIRLVGVKLTNLVSGYQQINLLEDTTELINLYQSLDRMNKRYGNGAVKRASAISI